MIHRASYEGTVFHQRHATRDHSFQHRVVMHYFDLDVAQSDRIRTEADAGVDGPVRLLSFGHGFNPVSFYYCFDRDEYVVAIVAEVTNTPWREQHRYVLTPDEYGALRGEFPKRLHVSPFFGLNQTYEWSATVPGDDVSVRLDNIENGERVFSAGVSLTRLPTPKRRSRFGGLRNLALIYGHAAVLRVKGVRPVPHPGATTSEPTRTR